MGLNSEQQKVLGKLIRRGRRAGATRKEIKAAVETGLVESNLRNLHHGDADSQGWRQERASLYKNPTNLNASIDRFYKETRAVRGKYGKAGDLAAAVQRPAAQYRGRYHENSSKAEQLLRNRGAAAGGTTARAAGGGKRRRAGRTVQGADTKIVTNTPGVDRSAERLQLVQNFLSDRKADPVDFAIGMRDLKDVKATSRTQRIEGTDYRIPGRGGHGGKRSQRGGGGAGGGGGRRRAGVDLTPRGGWTGTNGPISDFSRQGKKLGLQVSSSKRNNTNPYSGNRSDHDFGNKDATARDMSDGSAPTPAMDAYAKRVADRLGIPYKKGTPINKRAVKNGVRYQLIYRGTGPAFGGNHMNHVHLGAKRVGKGGSSKGVL